MVRKSLGHYLLTTEEVARAGGSGMWVDSCRELKAAHRTHTSSARRGAGAPGIGRTEDDREAPAAQLIECAGTAPEIDALPNTLYFVRSSNQIVLITIFEIRFCRLQPHAGVRHRTT